MTLITEQFLNKIEESENRGTTKSSHTKNHTTCKDIQLSGEACGICGSYNIVYQGLYYCIICGKEVELLRQKEYWWWNTSDDKNKVKICNCKNIKNKYGFLRSPRHTYHICKCLDCGSIDHQNFCLNCKKEKNYQGHTWKHWDGRIRCGRCGFTISDPIICNMKSNFKRKNAQGKLGTKKYMSKRKQKRLNAKNKIL